MKIDLHLDGYTKEHIIAYVAGGVAGAVFNHVGNAVIQPIGALGKGLVKTAAVAGGMLVTNAVEIALTKEKKANSKIKYQDNYVIIEL